MLRGSQFRQDPPSVFLPKVRHLSAQSPVVIDTALVSLRDFFWPAVNVPHRKRPYDDGQDARSLATLPSLDAQLRATKKAAIPDSGYASAEEDEGEEKEQLEIFHANSFERAYAVQWLTALIAQWTTADDDAQRGEDIIDAAAALLARCANTQTSSGVLSRHFVFGDIAVELCDEPYTDDDPAAVGLQTWGSANVLAGLICTDPAAFGLQEAGRRVRVLELGAGTGLLSLAVSMRCPRAEVVATDFHPAVLANLRRNVARNAAAQVHIDVLDWEHPPRSERENMYDVILAADVLYDMRHGGWIKQCAVALLKHGIGVMWIIAPQRPTRGREVACVVDEFAGGQDGLGILNVEDIERQKGIGRADETCYRLFKVGWR